MKNRKLLVVGVLLSIAAVFILTSCNALGNAQKLQEYDFGNDRVASINSVVGERTVTAVGTGTSNGVSYKEYTYNSSSVFEDLLKYTQELRNKGWIVTGAFDLNNTPGTGQLAINSADKGKILILSFLYDSGSYKIKIEKGTGDLTVN